MRPRPPALPVAGSCGFLSANVGLDWVQWIVSLLLSCMFARLQSNRNKNARKPATIAKVAGGGWRTMPCGWRLRVAGGMVRAGEFAGGGKWEEMNNPCQFPSQKARDGEQTNSRKVYFTLPHIAEPSTNAAFQSKLH